MTILENNLKAIKELNDNLTKLVNTFPDKRLSFEGVALVGEEEEYVTGFPGDQAVYFEKGFKVLRNLAFSMSKDLKDIQKILEYKMLMSITDDNDDDNDTK